MVKLSNDSDKLLCCVYKTYLERRKNGYTKDVAANFTDTFYKDDKILSTWLDDDISSTLVELSKAKFIRLCIDGNFSLSPESIIYMENRFKNGLSEIVEYIAKLFPLIPLV